MNTEILKDFLYIVVGAIYTVHEELGAGLNESVYQEGLELELQSQHVFYKRELEIHPYYQGKKDEIYLSTRFFMFRKRDS